jgi:hypothetical protein
MEISEMKIQTKIKKKYIRNEGPVKVCKGKSRVLSVQETHPAAVAIKLNDEQGGNYKVTGYGVRLFDKDGAPFAVIKGVTKDKTGFCIYNSTVKRSKELMPELSKHIFKDRKGHPEAILDNVSIEMLSIDLLNKLRSVSSDGRMLKLKEREEKRNKKLSKKNKNFSSQVQENQIKAS